MRQQIFLEGRALYVIPCLADKGTRVPGGYKAAVADLAGIARLFSKYPDPLIGVATGCINCIDVIDIDPRHGGDRWFHEHRDRLPQTRTHATKHDGWHLIYGHLSGLRCSTSRIAPGVDIRAGGPHFIWWPAHGGRILCEGPIADFPRWIVEGEMGSTLKPDRSDVEPMGVDVNPPTQHELNYARRALGNHCYELRHCPEGQRNTKLNVLSYNMGRLIVRGWIPRDRVETYLLNCCEANGLLADDGLAQCRATIASGINAGMKLPYHEIDGAKLSGDAV
jgi:hypothetical protein